MPTPVRTALHSRSTAACMSSPARGKYRARFHWPTSSNTAPCAPPSRASASCGPDRTGRPGRSPAKAPNVTGVYGSRKVVVPTCGMGLPSELRHEAERVHVGGLALVGRHADGGVALHVLDRLEALAHRERDVLGGHVVLEVDERTCRLQGAGLRQHARQAVHAELMRLHAVFRRRDRIPCRQRRRRAHARAVIQDLGVTIDPAARTCRRFRLSRNGRQERLRASLNSSLPRDCENKWTLGV